MSAAPQANVPMALPSTPDKKPPADDFDTIISVKIGPGFEAKTYEMYKGVLRFYSGYFRTAIDNIESGRFAEAEQGYIHLPEEELKVFHLFKGWLYTREFPSAPSTDDHTSWLQILKLWIFADRRDIPLLQNETLDCFPKWCTEKNYVPTIHLVYVWNNTSEGSLLRAYLVSRMCSRFTIVRDLKGFPGRYPIEVTHEMLAHLLEKRPAFQSSEAFAKMDKCQWHVHEKGVSCNKKKTSTG